MEKKYVGALVVDSAHCVLADPMVLSSEVFDKVSDVWMRSEDAISKIDGGFVVRTGSGDGCYPVFATYDDLGIIRKIEIDFQKTERPL